MREKLTRERDEQIEMVSTRRAFCARMFTMGALSSCDDAFPVYARFLRSCSRSAAKRSCNRMILSKGGPLVLYKCAACISKRVTSEPPPSLVPKALSPYDGRRLWRSTRLCSRWISGRKSTFLYVSTEEHPRGAFSHHHQSSPR